MATSDAPNVRSYRGLLALVIILGVLIVFSVGALIAAAVLRSGGPASSEPYHSTIGGPGQRVESTQIDGNRILVRLSGPSGEELVVLDAASGRLIGRIAIASPP